MHDKRTNCPEKASNAPVYGSTWFKEIKNFMIKGVRTVFLANLHAMVVLFSNMIYNAKTSPFYKTGKELTIHGKKK